MNRRGFLRAAVAAGLALAGRGPVTGEGRPAEKPDAAYLIRTALRERRQLAFRYHDHPRRVEPHALGRMKDGRPALLAWQVAGGSRSEPPPGWRTFIVAAMAEPALREERIALRPDYRPEKGNLGEILAEVAP